MITCPVTCEACPIKSGRWHRRPCTSHTHTGRSRGKFSLLVVSLPPLLYQHQEVSSEICSPEAGIRPAVHIARTRLPQMTSRVIPPLPQHASEHVPGGEL